MQQRGINAQNKLVEVHFFILKNAYQNGTHISPHPTHTKPPPMNILGPNLCNFFPGPHSVVSVADQDFSALLRGCQCQGFLQIVCCNPSYTVPCYTHQIELQCWDNLQEQYLAIPSLTLRLVQSLIRITRDRTPPPTDQATSGSLIRPRQLQKLASQALTDKLYVAPIMQTANWCNESKFPVYLYVYSHPDTDQEVPVF